MFGIRIRLVTVVALGVLAATVAACSSTPTSSASKDAAPTGLPSFYSVPSRLPSTAAGTLVRSQEVPSDGIHGHVYRVMYVSEAVNGRPTAVTGLVMVPDAPPPTGGYPVVTWGHGTNGMADQCAPSLAPNQAVPLQNQLLDQG